MITLKIESEDMLIVKQRELETKYSKQNNRKVVLEEIQNQSPDIMDRMHNCRTAILKWCTENHHDVKQNMLDELIRMEEESNNTLITRMLTDIMVAVLLGGRRQEFTAVVGQCINCLPWEREEYYSRNLERMGEILSHMSDADLFDIDLPRNTEEGVLMITNHWSLEDSTIELLALTKFIPPMICPPKPIKNDKQSGYLKHSAKVMSKWWNQNREGADLRYDFLNKRNATAFTLDIDYLMAMEDIFEPEVDELDPNDLELMKEQWETYQLDTKKIAINIHNQSVSAGGDGKIWFNTFYDNRGRVYARGYHISYQGNSHRKAMVNFADRCDVTNKESSIGLGDYRDFFK